MAVAVSVVVAIPASTAAVRLVVTAVAAAE